MPNDGEELEEQATCGTGLAESAELQRRLGHVADGLAGVLRTHLRAIDARDEASRPEYDAYDSLARQAEQIAGQLRALADEMFAYRGLPMANHDMEAMAHPRMSSAFEAFVNAKRDLRLLLEAGEEEDQAMLREMQSG